MRILLHSITDQIETCIENSERKFIKEKERLMKKVAFFGKEIKSLNNQLTLKDNQ